MVDNKISERKHGAAAGGPMLIMLLALGILTPIFAANAGAFEHGASPVVALLMVLIIILVKVQPFGE